MSKVAGNRKLKKGDFGRISRKSRCRHVSEQGERCKQKTWRGKKVCYQHDPEMGELRGHAGRPAYAKASAGKPRNRMELTSVEAVQESLAETLEGLRTGKIRAGEAYAAGYLAQLALTALEVERKESKLDVKHFWDVVDLGAAFERAAAMAKEREKQKEAEEAGTSASPQDEEAVAG